MTSHAASVNNISHFISAYNSSRVKAYFYDSTDRVSVSSSARKQLDLLCDSFSMQRGSESTVMGEVTDILNFSSVPVFSGHSQTRTKTLSDAALH